MKQICVIFTLLSMVAFGSGIDNPPTSRDIQRAGGVITNQLSASLYTKVDLTGQNFSDYPSSVTATFVDWRGTNVYQWAFSGISSGKPSYGGGLLSWVGSYWLAWNSADMYTQSTNTYLPQKTGWTGSGTMTLSYTNPASSSAFLSAIGAASTGSVSAVAAAAQMNSRTTPCTNYTIIYTAPATNIAGRIYILGPTNTWIGAVGSVEFVSRCGYLADVSGTVVTAPDTVLLAPGNPLIWDVSRTSNTSIIFTAYCEKGGNASYWAYLTNAVPLTYTMPGLTPNSVTNDGAGVLQRSDNLPDGWTSDADGRLVVNAASLVSYIDSRVAEIAKEAWNYTPGGKAVPSKSFVTIDEPLIQQGTIAYMQSGDYYCQSYTGGDWWTTAEGSEWWIGPSGSKAFGISSTNKILNIVAFNVSGSVATLDISTNGVVGIPEILTADLLNPAGGVIQWIKCPSQTITNAGSYWRAQCDASADSRFYRAVSAGGEQRIISKYPVTLEQGIDNGAGAILNLMTVNLGGTNYQFYGRVAP